MPQMLKNLSSMPEAPGSIAGLGSSPGEGHGSPLQYSCLKNPMTEEPEGLQSMGCRVRSD